MEEILLLVIEINFKDERDHFAQVLLKLSCGCPFYYIVQVVLKQLYSCIKRIATENWCHNHPSMPS